MSCSSSSKVCSGEPCEYGGFGCGRWTGRARGTCASCVRAHDRRASRVCVPCAACSIPPPHTRRNRAASWARAARRTQALLNRLRHVGGGVCSVRAEPRHGVLRDLHAKNGSGGLCGRRTAPRGKGRGVEAPAGERGVRRRTSDSRTASRSKRAAPGQGQCVQASKPTQAMHAGGRRAPRNGRQAARMGRLAPRPSRCPVFHSHARHVGRRALLLDLLLDRRRRRRASVSKLGGAAASTIVAA